MNLKNLTINFLGDSITEGVGTSGEKARFSYLIYKQYKLKKANNYGISGTRFAKQTKPSDNPRWDLDFCTRVHEMDKTADVNVVFGGVNDFGHGDAPIGTMSDRTPDTFYGACHHLFSSLLTEHPKAVNVICTPLHCLMEDNTHGRVNKAVESGVLKTYVEIIKEVATYYSLPICDLNAISGLQPSVPKIQEIYLPDGIHPNDEGHKILASRIGEFLKSL